MDAIERRAERFADSARRRGLRVETRRTDTDSIEVLIRGQHEGIQIFVRPSQGNRSSIWAQQYSGITARRLRVSEIQIAISYVQPEPVPTANQPEEATVNTTLSAATATELKPGMRVRLVNRPTDMTDEIVEVTHLARARNQVVIYAANGEYAKVGFRAKFEVHPEQPEQRVLAAKTTAPRDEVTARVAEPKTEPQPEPAPEPTPEPQPEPAPEMLTPAKAVGEILATPAKVAALRTPTRKRTKKQSPSQLRALGKLIAADGGLTRKELQADPMVVVALEQRGHVTVDRGGDERGIDLIEITAEGRQAHDNGGRAVTASTVAAEPAQPAEPCTWEGGCDKNAVPEREPKLCGLHHMLAPAAGAMSK